MTTYYGPLGLRNCFSSLITLFLTIFAISLFLNKAHLPQEETPSTPSPSSPPIVLNVSKVERQEGRTTPILPQPAALNISKVRRQEERITIPYPPPPVTLNVSKVERQEERTTPILPRPAALNISKVERQEERITIPYPPPPVTLNVSKVERQEERTTPILPRPAALNISKVERQEERIAIHYPPPPPVASNASKGDDKCDLFSGRWVYDNSTHPLYSGFNCSFMHEEIACDKFGRKDRLYQNWRWQPHGCDIPRFDATKLLERLRGKRMVFVGDSLNRNQWVSMVCLVGSSLPPKHNAMKFNGSLLSFKSKDFNATIDFYWSPMLLESNGDDPIIHRSPDRIIRAHSIEKHAKHWANADIIIFNSYLWWKKQGIKLKILYGSFEDEDKTFEEVELGSGLEIALRTWSEWLESHVDTNKTQIFFVSVSPTHVWADEWGMPSDQNCYTETEPIIKEGYASRGTDYSLMRTVEAAVEGLRYKGVHVQILNITQLSEYRKDGHPSIYRRQYVPLTENQLANPRSYSDCTHWCLPGVPDTWNELLYAYIMSR